MLYPLRAGNDATGAPLGRTDQRAGIPLGGAVLQGLLAKIAAKGHRTWSGIDDRTFGICRSLRFAPTLSCADATLVGCLEGQRVSRWYPRNRSC